MKTIHFSLSILFLLMGSLLDAQVLTRSLKPQEKLTKAFKYSPLVKKVNQKTNLRFFHNELPSDYFRKYDLDFIKEFTFVFENDVVFGVDEDYTTGVALNWKTRYLKTPLFFGFKDQGTPKYYSDEVKDYTRNHTTISLGTYYYTPSNLLTAGVDSMDRPYASMQYMSLGRISDRKRIRMDGIRNTYVRFQSELQLGLVGGPLARNLQSWIHENITHGPIPQGWHNQIGGNNNRLVLNYMVEYEVMWLYSNIREKMPLFKKNQACAAYAVYNQFQLFNLSAFLNGSLGNIRTDFAFGLNFNLLNFNMANEHFLNYYDGGLHDYPAGSPPIIRYDPKSIFNEVIEDFNKDRSCNNCDLRAMRFKVDEIIRELGINILTCTKEEAEEINEKVIQLASDKIRGLSNSLQNSRSGHLQEQQELQRWTAVLRYFQRYRTKDNRSLLNTQTKFHNRRWAAKVYLRPQLRWVGSNSMLQGVLFDDSSPYTIELINPFVFEIRGGLQFKWHFMNIQLGYVGRSQEYGNGSHPGLSPGKSWHSWGDIRLSINPNLLADAFERLRLVSQLKKSKRAIKSINPQFD